MVNGRSGYAFGRSDRPGLDFVKTDMILVFLNGRV